MSKNTILQFEKLVNSLTISDESKENLISKELLAAHSFYIDLPSFILSSIEDDKHNIVKEKLSKLAFCSYLYFRSLLLFDAMNDSEVADRKVSSYVFFNFFEIASRELGRIFEHDAEFWIDFECCKQKYFKAQLWEKEKSKKRQKFHLQEFEKLAIGKSAICDAIVFAFRSLFQNDLLAEDWLFSLHHIHIAFQYLDDLDDFKKDYFDGQWTYAQSLVEESIKEQKYKSEGCDINFKYRYLYTSGIALKHIDSAIQHFKKAKSVFDKNVKELNQFIDYKIRVCESQSEEIRQLLKKTTEKISKSNITKNCKAIISEVPILEALNDCSTFLANNINSDGYWEDFLTSGGRGKNWITNYVVSQLSEYSDSSVLNKLSSELFIRHDAGYNEMMMPDADSINFLIATLHFTNKDIDRRLHEKWLDYLNPDGGWSTYKDERELRKRLGFPSDANVKGWSASHTCVSATATFLLSLDESMDRSLYESCINFLVNRLSRKGFLASYWWSSPIYATAYFLMSIAANLNYKLYASVLADWIGRQQSETGAWPNPATQIDNPFYTSLAAKSLLIYDSRKFSDQIEKAILWLLRSQKTDGSWPSDYILRIPAADVVNPDGIHYWRKSSFGVNTLIDDHERVFSSATVYNLLNKYKLHIV